ncbi:AEC family transporter [Chelatococcus sp. SYSU_G07232]|uniref:AEC family transporter n=1 Tax=Chelatococcus albus TaxID=3047466 RepID=A0ABT7ACT8_9HYPH|nr:AEC family transporter [Chelatococcus sp. SYSU_G07232]MDJ1157186.1 AEC family transporter [Chelatococcus sp. SYSU_G07232]
MLAVLDSLVPVFLVIITGWGTRVARVIDDRQWAGFERVTYYVFFPAVVIETLAKANLRDVPFLGLGGSLVAGILTMTLLLLVLRRPLEAAVKLDGPAFTSVFQGATRWNTFVALAVAGSLFGPAGVTLIAVAIAAMIPLLNVVAVLVLVRFAGGPAQSPRMILRTLATNPFIWSCAIGIALNWLAPPVPKALMAYAEMLGRASLAAGLLVVGAGLDLARLARPRIPHLVSAGLKLALMPLLVVSFARLLGVTGTGLAVAVIAASVPTASGSYILARQLGGDAPLMAEIVTLQTLLAAASMPLAITLLA